MAQDSSCMKMLVVALLAIASPAAAQPASWVPLMVSRTHKQHNRNWYAKTPPKIAPLTQPTCSMPCKFGCCDGDCCPDQHFCASCPEECCEGSCACAYVGAEKDPSIECPDECCGQGCCSPPKPPAACAGCDADHCCHGACQARACTPADAP